jgi:hypothetical protein
VDVEAATKVVDAAVEYALLIRRGVVVELEALRTCIGEGSGRGVRDAEVVVDVVDASNSFARSLTLAPLASSKLLRLGVVGYRSLSMTVGDLDLVSASPASC